MVGVINTSIDIGVFMFLKYIFQIDNQSGLLIVINLISIVLAIIFSYFANKYITFKQKSTTNTKEVSGFIAVNLFGFLINTTILRITISLLPAEISLSPIPALIDPALIGKILGTTGSMIVSFFGYKLFVFNK
jgi:putative flippase GtrA